MAAFVLGNGQSRAAFDIDRLMTLGPVYGCNALYRTHAPTALVATDQPIARQIQESGYSQINRFYTRRPLPGYHAEIIPKPYHGFSSGPVAVALAALDGNIQIYLLGFDLGANLGGQFNNVYAGTEFYKPHGAPPTFTGNWIRQIMCIAKDFPGCRFTRVHGVTTTDVTEFLGVQNMKKLTGDEFLARINTPKDL